MTNILMICTYFSPDNKIGAIRMNKLSKYLSQQETYAVTVLTPPTHSEAILDRASLRDVSNVQVVRLTRRKWLQCLHRAQKISESGASHHAGTKAPNQYGDKLRKSRFAKIIQHLLTVRAMLEDSSSIHCAKQALRRDPTPYQAVISTFSTNFGHQVALWYRKTHPGTVWIADFRDPVLYDSYPWYRRNAQKRLFRKTASHADALMAVSQGVLDVHCREIPPQLKTYVLENGFDPDDLPVFPPSQETEDQILRFVYTGSLYHGARDLTPLFHALNDLSQKGAVDMQKICVAYAGHEGAIIRKQAAQYGLSDIVMDHGYCTRTDALKLQAAADVLLLASWNQQGSTGVITGKFYEYLMMGKPILCIISGDLPNSLLKKMIEKANCGFCVEEAQGASDSDQLKQWIRDAFAAKQNTGSVPLTANQAYVDSFNYQSITHKLLNIMRNYEKK
jgi:hypothetical protein